MFSTLEVVYLVLNLPNFYGSINFCTTGKCCVKILRVFSSAREFKLRQSEPFRLKIKLNHDIEETDFF